MPKINTLQSNFSAGELSPKAYGRVDIARYPNAAKRLVNIISSTLGSADKRPGTQWIAAAKNNNKRARLVPYIVNRDSAYMLEVGDSYFRVFKPDGTQVMSGPSTPYEVTTPYVEANLNDIDYAQGEDAMYVFHSAVYPNRIRSFGDAKWDCSRAPFTTTPFAEQGDYPAANLTLSANTLGTGRTMTASASVFMASDVGRAITNNAGIFVITAFTSATQVTGEVKALFDSTSIATGTWNLDSSPQTSCTPSASTPVGASITLTLAADGWRSGDVGKFVRLNSGLVKLTAVGTALAATGTIIKALSATVAAPSMAWTLESSVWSATNGYPRTGTLHEQRLVVAGTTKNPQTAWGSRTGEPLDFTIGANDDDAYAFAMAGNNNQINPISFIVSARNLLVLTYGGEYSIQSGVEKPITPTNVRIKPESPHGVNAVRPVQVGKETLFAQRAGKKVRAMGFRYDEDGYKSPDLTTLGEHLTAAGIAGMCFQQEPDPVVWIWLNNGKFISITIDRELDVIAWNQHETDGAVESMAVMPGGDKDQVWMIVRRKVNGSIVKYIERLQPDWYPIYGTTSPDPDAFPPQDAPYAWGFQLDCAITADDAAGKTTWTGLSHLEGKTVRCLADGVDMPPMTVSGGSVTLQRKAKRVHIGLMFKPAVEVLTPEIQGGTGTDQADAMSVSKVVLRLYNTLGAKVNGQLVTPGRSYSAQQLDKAPELFTGDKDVTKVGWAKGKAENVITQDDPFPFHLLAVIRTITINGG